ncbi:MAG TPA: ABC transporter substrate-binding protein [Casimicrobiaceae bacterium]|jgi:branched-chain amino acid transport system substrate-binding protein|nr:ABC transporter substrate-binding protein [Casimicrobiaceae bacterium]
MRAISRWAQAALALALLGSPAVNAQPIKLGELNSYKTFPAFLEPYKKGMELALEEVNRAGGVLGRPLELVVRDDNGNPGDAVRVAEELVAREKVDLLMGTFSSAVGLAVADFAKQRKVLFIASEPLTDKIVWESGNRYTFRLRPSTYMQTAMLVPAAAKLGKKRWAIVYPNYEYGTSATAAFKQQMIARQASGLEFVEVAVPLGKIDAGPVVQALIDAKPDAIFSSLFATDLAKFVREGELRGLFKDRPVFNLLGGEPEYLDPLKDEAPTGWYVTGYPWAAIATPEHKRFLDAYQAKFKDYPRQGSVVGYSAVMTVAAAIRKARSTDTAKLVAAMSGLVVDTPFGKVTFRALDHQSTMGAYVGRIAVKDGKGMMVDWKYADGAGYLPSDDWVRAHRPAD